MSFILFKKAVQKHFEQMTKDNGYLFEVGLDKDELWNLYLDSFPEGTNKIFRKRRKYDCSCCRNFIKQIGNVVTIKNGKVTSIWDLQIDIPKYQVVADALSKFVKSHDISDIYVSKLNKIGTSKNFEALEDGEIIEWDHFYLELPKNIVDVFSHKRNRSEVEIKADYRDTRNVFKRSLDEITEDSLLTVLELISQNSLYRGLEWKSALENFLGYKREYDKLNQEEKEIYAWEKSVLIDRVIGRIRNHSIGTLLVDISEGIDLETAVKKYEDIVAPENYKRSKPIYTKKMLEEAKKTVEELGYMDSLQRRFATLDDITVNNILFSNRDSAKRIEGLDVFEEMAREVSINPKKFTRVEEISIEDFINNVLPITQEVEVLFENKHMNNLVSLIAAENKDSKSMFKWNNNFSWAYRGNITDSSMKERVKSAGGNVEGVLRFSIQWNDGEFNPNDFDAHCIEPTGNEIYYGNKYNPATSGELDVDIVSPTIDVPAVENITWSNKKKMVAGKYRFFVHNYSHNGGRDGFKAEIEFDGQVFSFEYNKELRHKEKVYVATITLHENGEFSIKEELPSKTSSKEVWNLTTNQFIPVSVIMYSPNYWDGQKGIGHKHYFFMLKNCVNPEQPNGFYNEFLKQELYKHRRVFEALGSKMAVKDVEDQLSGLGFSSTKRNELIAKVKGNTERVLKIKF